MKWIILLAFGFWILSGCAGSGSRAVSADIEINSQAVVDTSFEDSFLYERFRLNREEGPLIPGLSQNLVPQGMAYWKNPDLMLISNYADDGSAGVITVLSWTTGRFEKALYLYNQDGSPHIGHLGGLAISDRFLWVASGSGVYSIALEDIKNSKSGESIQLSRLFETETKGSFATYSDGILWVGEFTRQNGEYPVPESHHRATASGMTNYAWLGGYKLDRETETLRRGKDSSGKIAPDYILSIPDEVQGAAFVDHMIVLSLSYGRKNKSRLEMYADPISDVSVSPEKLYSFSPDPTDLWILDDDLLLDRMIIPPMSEAVVLLGENLAVLFESGASKYRDTAQSPLDRIQIIPVQAVSAKEGRN